MLKLGVIDVLNVLPVFYQLLESPPSGLFSPVFGRVTELNGKLNRGELDLSVISSFEYAANPERYYILPELSVSSRGPVRSIYLFSSKPLEQLANQQILLTEFSLTSIHLIQWLLKDLKVSYSQDPYQPHAAELLIADDAIKRYFEKRDPFVYDLGELWYQKTGLPMVFALWVVRREVFDQSPKAVLALHGALLKSKTLAAGLLFEMSQSRFRGIFPSAKELEGYLANLHYEFSASYQEGFNLFMEKMVEINKLPQAAAIAFLPET